jgi:ABC-type transport system involved in multi-copper enzyme maturation permease subunit
MGKILTIGLNTFREAIRNKILYSLLFFALIVIIGSMAFGALSVREEARLTTDLGLGGMSIFSVIIAIFVGVNLVYKELERKTIYSLIPKPVHRYQFVLGKYLGMLITLCVLLVVMSLVLFGVVALQGEVLSSALIKMVLLIFLEVWVVTAVAVLFSSFSTPFLSGLFTLGIFLLGRSVPDIQALSRRMMDPEQGNIVAAWVLDIVTRILPNLRLFYASGTENGGAYVSVHGAFPDWSYVAMAAGYAGLFATLILMLAILLFSRRDFI